MKAVKVAIIYSKIKARCQPVLCTSFPFIQVTHPFIVELNDFRSSAPWSVEQSSITVLPRARGFAKSRGAQASRDY